MRSPETPVGAYLQLLKRMSFLNNLIETKTEMMK